MEFKKETIMKNHIITVYYMNNDGQRINIANFDWWYEAEKWKAQHYYDYGTDLYIESN